jgi:hypothetical protein
MAVSTELVVGRDDVGLVSADQPDEPAGGLVEVGSPEAARIEIADATHHVRVAVAEVLPLGDAQLAHRPLELGGPELGKPAMVVGRVHLGDDDLAHLAPRARHEDHAPAGRYCLCHRAAGADRLVVGVGVDGHEGRHVGRHPEIVSRARAGRRGVVQARIPIRAVVGPGATRFGPGYQRRWCRKPIWAVRGRIIPPNTTVIGTGDGAGGESPGPRGDQPVWWSPPGAPLIRARIPTAVVPSPESGRFTPADSADDYAGW